MAKKFVKVSLATKFRVLFGTSVLGIIAAALVVPWYFMERLADQGIERPAEELTRLRLNEWVHSHYQNPQAPSEIAEYYTAGGENESRKGPDFVRVRAKKDPALTGNQRKAVRTFYERDNEETLAVFTEEDDQGLAVYRCFRAVHVEQACVSCHRTLARPGNRFEPGQLVGMIDVTIPASEASDPLVWWTRGAFVVGGALAGFLAVVLFAIITQVLVLKPMRRLRQLADRVTEGDLSVRSTIQTGDEIQRLGDSFNEMLDATRDQHEKLRQANRALDLKLSELSESNVVLSQANQVKNEFLTNVSHELRTPLNSIIGFADLLADGEDEKVKRYGQNIVSAAKHLLAMINDLLDIAKIEAGKVQIRMDKVSVADTCQTLLSLMGPLADKKQLNLRMHLDGNLPIITTDAPKVQQVLYNLLSNAIKFTPPGGDVTLSAGLQDGQRDGKVVPEVFVSVADTGPGISEADHEHIFDKFYQVDRALTRETGGTGLGLPIAKELTGLLGGRLTLQSEPGHGATFTLHIPVVPAEM